MAGERELDAAIVFAALIECTVDAGIVLAGRELAAEAICKGVNLRLLNSPAKQVKL